ncbi:hypothetical protein [Micromonospora sp. WMMD998]|uniref:hypothetical protein n=1 Tax=Micromonospora sp. WMMD998 TaxID=3016092 RepID=UPI00249B8398|nr:hypothetical protein [Micromonospora sp. WMMD998]WFE41482.1 hypothetical protein O7619_24715 [Micromonospora sp. WMMD998]
MGQQQRRVAAVTVLLALLPVGLAGCGEADAGGAAAPTGRAPAEEAAAKSRERVQAYLDALAARDTDAGRSQLCAPMRAAFDAAATGPNGDFAKHFTVPRATITDVRTGSKGQEVSAVITVAAGSHEADRALLFTVTRTGADWCIAGEAPGGNSAAPSTTP